MLILSRKQGEAILMDGGIRIVVLSTENGGVRLGIEAPEHIGIVRAEILGMGARGAGAGRNGWGFSTRGSSPARTPADAT